MRSIIDNHRKWTRAFAERISDLGEAQEKRASAAMRGGAARAKHPSIRWNRGTRAAGWLLGGCLALGSAGCFFEASSDTGPAPPPVVQPSPGRLELRWTVDEVTDPNVCIQSQAPTLDVVVTTTDGQFVGEFQAACTAFATSVTLSPGSYAGSARLLGPSGQARTTTLNINPFNIVDNSALVVDIDFPADSFP